jgi:hypothetical protein
VDLLHVDHYQGTSSSHHIGDYTDTNNTQQQQQQHQKKKNQTKQIMELQKAELEELWEKNKSNWCELRDLRRQLWKAK